MRLIESFNEEVSGASEVPQARDKWILESPATVYILSTDKDYVVQTHVFLKISNTI